MKILTILIISFVSLTTFCQDKKIDSLKKEIQTLKVQIEVQNDLVKKNKEQLDYQTGQINSQASMLDTAFDGVSTQIGSSSNYISLFAIIITVVTIGLGIYVSLIERKIKSIAQDNETLLQKNVQIRQDILLLSDKIINDSKGLFKIMRDEESNHIIERLLKVPNDIINVGTLLVSRELEPVHFEKVKEAFTQTDKDLKHYYDTIFFQHFSGLAITDELIKPRILGDLPELIKNSFKNDILKTATEYFYSIYKGGIESLKIELNAFIKALSESKYSNYEEIYIAIYNQMPSRDAKFLLYENVDKEDYSKIFRKEFGKLLLNFKDENQTASESGVINEIELLNSI